MFQHERSHGESVWFSPGWICESLCSFAGTTNICFYFIVYNIALYFFNIVLFGSVLHFCCLLKLFYAFVFRSSIDFAWSSIAHHIQENRCWFRMTSSWDGTPLIHHLSFLFNLIIVTCMFSYHVFKYQVACFMFHLHLKSSLRVAFPNKNPASFSFLGSF